MKRIHILFIVLLGFSISSSAQYHVMDELPNMHVNDIYQDPDNFVWISTDYGLCKFNGSNYLSYYHLDSDASSIPSNKVICARSDSRGMLWVLTRSGVSMLNQIQNSFSEVCELAGMKGMVPDGDGMLCYSSNGFIHVSADKTLSMHQLPVTVQTAISLPEDRLAVALHDGSSSRIEICDRGLSVLISADMGSSAKVLTMAYDGFGCLWVGLENGVKVLELSSMDFIVIPELEQFNGLQASVIIPSNEDVYLCFKGADIHHWRRKEGSVTGNLAKKKVFNLNYTSDFSCGMSDGLGMVWVGTTDRGFSYRSEQDIAFVNNSSILRATTGKYMNSATVSSDGIFWLASSFKGLLCINDKSHECRWYNYQEANRLPLESIDVVFCDLAGHLWLSSGKEVAIGKVNGFDFMPLKAFSLNAEVYAFCEDADRNIWAATENGAVRLSPDGPEEIALAGHRITDLLQTPTGMLAAVSNSGIVPLDGSDRMDAWMKSPELQNINDLALAPDGTIWVATAEKGVFLFKDGVSRQFTMSEGLQCDEIQSIVFDTNGNAWIGTSYGLSLIKKGADSAVTYTKHGNLPVSQFLPRSAAVSGNTVCISGVSGLTLFSSSRIISRISPRPVNLYLSSIRSNGTVLTDIRPDGICRLNDRKKVILPYSKRSIAIDYEAVEFKQPETICFAYRLKGLEKDWNYVGYSHIANYSNLSSGHYVFELIAMNPDGYWNETPKTLQIVVRPSPFLAFYSIILYIIILIASIWLVFRFIMKKKLQEQRLEMAMSELENEKMVARMKVDFFTNISHELRTSLSLIYGPINMLESADEKKRHSLISHINSNTLQLVVLIDQLLNLSRIENGCLPLMVSEADLNQQLQRIVNAFSTLAEKKGIVLTLESDIADDTRAFFDTDKLYKILSNLISNAIKYNKDGGYVKVMSSVNEGMLVISVIDNGVGMSEEDAKLVFDRYRRLHSVEKSAIGSGVGLHYAKQLAILHKGDIAAKVRAVGGMNFTVSLPVSAEAYSQDERCGDLPAIIDGFANVETASEMAMDAAATQDARSSLPLVAVIEDNSQLREYLKSLLSENYRVVTASDAQQGFNLLEAEMPDIITTDVMMEGMDGYEFCRRIKENPLWCHIPVVMLTAKVTDEDKIAGFKSKANAYITKPFNPELLFTVIRNLLDEREALRHSLLAQEQDSESRSILSEHDARFIEKLNAIIEENIGEPSVSVSELCDKLAIGRSSFFRKMKALTGVSPNEYILVYKLNRSIELLKEGKMNISEIGYFLGFCSPSHFIKTFKGHFGKTPKEFIS